MFGELLESRAKPVRNRAGTILSVAGHAACIAFAVAATRSPLIAKGPGERIVPLPTLALPAPTAPVIPAGPTRAPSSPAPDPRGPLVTAIPIIALPGIPAIDLNIRPATDIGWRSDGSRPSSASGPGAGVVSSDGIPFAAGVDKPAMALSGNPSPRYPEALRRANVRGEVVLQVVIDTTGRADMKTVRVMSSNHPLLTDAALEALPRARFLPAESGGKKVRMWAVQSFVFQLR